MKSESRDLTTNILRGINMKDNREISAISSINKYRVIDLFWEKIPAIESHSNCSLYQIYGYHILYGNETLLYIGRTKNFLNRIKKHSSWFSFEQNISFRRAVLNGKSFRYLEATEALLIYSHSPAYNSSNIVWHHAKGHLLIRNFGEKGILLPEISKDYWDSFYNLKIGGWGKRTPDVATQQQAKTNKTAMEIKRK